MLKILFYSFISIIILFWGCQLSQEIIDENNMDGAMDLASYVNPLVGSASSFKLSHGNTYPAVALPFGMNFWTPQTGDMGDGWIYTYGAQKIQGFRCTHQPSPWMNDYGAFSLMPMVGKLEIDGKKRGSRFEHENEISYPHYYKTELDTYGVIAEMTATERSGYFRFTYPPTNDAYIVLDAFHEGSMVKVIPKERKVIGYCKNNSGGVPDNFASYFVVVFDKPFTTYGTWQDSVTQVGKAESEGDHTGAFLKFKTEFGEEISVKVASSFISLEQAELNLNREVGDKDFDDIKDEAQTRWNSALHRAVVEGGTEEQKATFYTALYRTMLFPRKFYEFDEENSMQHYSPYDGKVHEGYMYTDNGFWDTFRAAFPLLNILYPEMTSHIMEGFVNAYKEGGWLPTWPSPGYRKVMIGSHSASLFAEAYLKGNQNFDYKTAYKAIRQDATKEPPAFAPGRDGLKAYNRLGYVPYPDYKEATAKTLEYAYDDFCIMRMAQALNKNRDAKIFERKAMNYQNVFDKGTNFMRGRQANGQWVTPFDPVEWGGPFTEGNAWHYNWSVFHDIQGLIDLTGGREKFVAKLDSVFTVPPDVKVGTYDTTIHEMTEMVLAKMGQYAHGNQPIQHMIYLYDYAQEPWKTQYWTRYVMDSLYAPTPNGLIGDEDNGQTSAWYVFSALGFYPVCPVVPSYAIGSPLFDQVTLHLDNGNIFEIVAENNGPVNYYIQEAELNGRRLDKTWITHQNIMGGGRLRFVLDEQPNKDWGSDPEDVPYSLSNENVEFPSTGR